MKSSVQTLQECLDIDGEDLGSSFGGCVANFCNPSDWGQGRYGTLVSSLIKNSVRIKESFLPCKTSLQMIAGHWHDL